ncbi:hypothetical protein LTR53_007918 [Teratosphaeriaceae sp. CCFEE 6253]|nr:hypothetical protein LTR53_007918 [Teratosphaeriaceae sp. CCFEE 6253]
MAAQQDIVYQQAMYELLEVDPNQEALCRAVREGNEQALRQACLRRKGLPTLRPKAEAVRQGRSGFLKVLLESDDTVSEDLVAAACEPNDMASMRLLLDFGARSMRSYALQHQYFDFMQWLIDSGADINAVSTLDEPVLAYAIAHGDYKVVRPLLALDADIWHGNLLHCAAERSDHAEGVELVTLLAQRGADVDAYRYDNPVARRERAMSRLHTPLHVACYQRNIPVAKALVRHGADIYRWATCAANG